MSVSLFRTFLIQLICVCLWSPQACAESKAANASRPAENEAGPQAQFVPLISWTESGITSWSVLLCLHGLGLHKAVYEPFARQMERVGVRTYAIDLRGFGAFKQSSYGNVLDWKSTLADIETVVKSIRRENPGLPVVLLGESMGGAVAIQAAAIYPGLVDGVITCVPSGMRKNTKKDQLRTAVGLLRGASKPMNMAPSLVKRVTENTSLQEQWMADEKARLLLSPKELISFQGFMNQTGSMAAKLKDLPVLMVQGGQDKLVKTAGNADLFRKLGTVDKDLVVLGTSEHLIFEQGQFDEQVVSVVSSWLLKHVIAAETRAQKRKDQGRTGLADATVLKKDSVLTNFNPLVQQQAIGHFFLAQGFLRLQNKVEARNHFEQVIKIAPESMLASESRVLLVTALKSAEDEASTDAQNLEKVQLNFVSAETALNNPLPTMIVFYTKWLFRRAEIEREFKELQLSYAGKLNLVKLDADDPANRDFVRQFKITCVPTFVFLDGKNRIMDKRLGCTDGRDIMEGIVKILPAHEPGDAARGK